MREIRTYEYWIQDYHGRVEIACDENAENDTAHSLAEKAVAKGSPFGMGYREFKLLSRRRIES